GAGGGGGGYGEKFILADDLASSTTVTVGAGGLGRSALSGTEGGASHFGNHIAVQGGAGGDWTTTVTSSAQGGRAGAVALGVDFSVPGQEGQQGRMYNASGLHIYFPGSGGSSFLGLGGVSIAPNQTSSGRVGTGWGSGGSGAAGGPSDAPGGDGRQGIV